jgi:MFS family permease
MTDKIHRYKNLIAVSLLSLVNVLGFSILIPVLPFIVEAYGAGEITYGFLLSIYAVCQFVAAPYLGSLSDKHGRKPILIISQLGTLLSWVLFAVAWFVPTIPIVETTVPIVIISISRIIDGITGGNAAVAYAYLSDITPPEKRAKYFGVIAAVIGGGFLIGPIMGSYSSATPLGYLGTIILTASISLLTLIFLRFFLDESLEPKDRSPKVQINLKKELNLIARINKFKDNRTVTNLFWMWLFYSLAFASYVTIIIIHIIEIFNLTEKEVGNVMLIVGALLIFNQLVISRFASKWLGEKRALLSGLVLTMIGLVLMNLTTDLYIFLGISYIFGLGISLTLPTFKALFTNAVNKNQQGEVMGIDESINSFSMSVAPLTATLIYSQIGGWAFAAFALLVLTSLLTYLVQQRTMNLQPKSHAKQPEKSVS